MAIVAVMLHHYLSRYSPPHHTPSLYGYRHSYPLWLDLGGMGVQFFFIISGFVIFMTLQHSRHLLEFWIRRIARLYPAYLVAMLITFSVVRAIGPPEMHASTADLAVGFTFLSAYIPGIRFVDGSYWSLVEELKFYCVVGLLYTFFRERFVLTWSLYACMGALLWWLGASAEWHWLRMLARHFFITETVAYFTAGILFYKIYTGETRGCWTLAAGALAAYVATVSEFNNPPELLAYRPLVTLFMLLLFTLFVYRKLEWLAIRPLVFLGSVSYSFYLLHQYIGVSLIPYFTGWLGFPDLLACASAGLVNLLLAFGLTRLVEVPAKELLVRWAKRRILPSLESALPTFTFSVPSRTAAMALAPAVMASEHVGS